MKKQIVIYILTFFYILISLITPITAEWSNPILISSESEKSAYRAIIGIDIDDNLHIAWKDNSNYSNAGDDWDIFYKFKPKNGNWTKTEIVSVESTNDSNCLFMSVDKNKTVHVVWKDQTDYDNAGNDFDTFYKYKPFNGEWSKMQLVSINSTNDTGCPCSTIDKNGNLHVVWSDWIDPEGSSDDWDVYFSKLNDDGNFSDVELVSTESTDNSFEPTIAVDSKYNIHVVWYEKSNYGDSGNDYDIFYKYKPLNENWTKTTVVSKESTGSSTIPALTVDSDDILHLVWVDNTNIGNVGSDGDIFYKNKSLNKDWSEIQIVSTESNNYGHWPSITTDLNDTIHVVWKDIIVTDFSNNYEIYYKYKPKNAAWSNLELVSIKSESNSNWGSVVTNSTGGVHVSWWDDFDGQWIMYYGSRPSVDINIKDENEDIDDSIIEEKNDYNIYLVTLIIILLIIIGIALYFMKIKK